MRYLESYFNIFKKKKDNRIDDILQKDKIDKGYHAWDGSNIISISPYVFGDNDEQPLSGAFLAYNLYYVIRWKEDRNENAFIICHLSKYKSQYFLLIKAEEIIKDLLEVINGRMTILWAYVQDYEDDILFKFVLREIDFEDGDDMPEDIWLDNFNYVKDGMKKKSEKYKTYVSNNDIKRTNRLYDVEFNEYLDTDNKNGLIRVEINPTL